MKTLTAEFEVTGWDEHQFDRHAGTAKLTRAKVDKTYSGAITGSSVTQWLMAYHDDGTATFVGIERIQARIAGRSGTIVVQHVGGYVDGSATADLTIVAGSSSGELVGLGGSGRMVADPAGHVSLDIDDPTDPGLR